MTGIGLTPQGATPSTAVVPGGTSVPHDETGKAFYQVFLNNRVLSCILQKCMTFLLLFTATDGGFAETARPGTVKNKNRNYISLESKVLLFQNSIVSSHMIIL